MNSFGPQSYSTCLKRMVPTNFKMNKEAIIMLCSIIYEINLNLIKACLSNKNRGKDVTAKYVESAIRRLIPKDLRECALAAGYSEIVKYQSGLIIYKDPKIPKPLNLDPDMLRKGLQQLAETSHRNLTLSKNCSTVGCIIYKLAIQMAEKSISKIEDNNELSLEDLRSTVFNILGDELFAHSEGHAASNLNWYISDTLDFTLKPLHSDGIEETPEEESELLPKYIQKLAKTQYSVSFTKNGEKTVDKILKEIVHRILEDTRNLVVSKDLQNLPVSEYVMYEVVQKLFPPVVFKLACSYAQGRVLNYSCGMLKYQYKRPVEEIEAVPVDPDDVEFTEENVLPDYRTAVKRLMQEYHCTPARKFLPMMNDILNDVGAAFAEMCSQSARRNNNILSENDVFAAVNTLLPEGLRNHAFARIVHVGRECPPENRQVIDMLMLAPKHAPYEFDQAYSLPEKPPQLTEEISVASPLEESLIDTRGTDSKEVFTRQPSLPHDNVSSFLKNERSIKYTHDAPLSPFPDYSPDASKITEEKPQEHSYPSIRRPFQGTEQNGTSIEPLSRQAPESLHGDQFSRLSGIVSKIDAKYSEGQIPKSDIPAVNRKQSPSNINEVNLSNVPSLPPIESKNLWGNIQDEKYISLDPLLPRTESVPKLYEEKPSSQGSKNDVSAVNTKQRPSYINEVKLSNDPSLAPRESKNFGENLQDEKYNSLDPSLPRSESVSKSYKEKPSESSQSDVSAVNRKQSPSHINEFNLSNVPSLPPRESKNLGGNIQDEKYISLDPLLPRTDSVPKLYEEKPSSQGSKNDVSAVNTKQRPSYINEVKLSNDPSLAPRESKNFGENLQDEKYNSLDPSLPRRESVSKSYKEKPSESSQSDVSAVNRKQSPSHINEVNLSNVPSLPPRESKNLGGNIQDENYISLDPLLPRIESVTKLYEEKPSSQGSKNDVSAVNTKQLPSAFNEIKLSNVPSLPPRESKKLGENLQDEKYNSLDPLLPHRESKLSEETSSKSSYRDMPTHLSDDRQTKKDNEDQPLETSDKYGLKEPSGERDGKSFLTYASEDSDKFAEQQTNYQDLSGNISAAENETLFDDNKKQIQRSKQSIHPESISFTPNQVSQDASSSSDEKGSTTINNGNGVSGFLNLIQQASNSILNQFQDRFSTSKENVDEKDKSTLEDVRLRYASGSNTVLDNNKENGLSPNDGRLHNLPTENKNGSSGRVHQAKYYTSGEEKPTNINGANRLPSVFSLFQQASNKVLHAFQDLVETPQERLPQDKQSIEDVGVKSSGERFQKLPSDALSREYPDTVMSKNKDQNSMETLTGSENQLNGSKDGHFSSISAYVNETLNKIENEQYDSFEDTITANEENEQDKVRKEYLYQEARMQNKTSMGISEEKMKNTDFYIIQDDEISADDMSTKMKGEEYEIIFLDIPRTIFWNDVRPYEFLM